MNQSVGQLLINRALPEQLRQDRHQFDKKSIHDLFDRLAKEHPDQYRETLKRLSDLARDAAWESGASVSLSGLRKSAAKERVLGPVRAQLQRILDDPTHDQDPDARDHQIVNAVLPAATPLIQALQDEAKQENSPYHVQIASGGRGKASDLNSLRGADLLATDTKNRPIPIPVLSSYADGFDPVEWFAGTFSQRRSAVATKLATADAGYGTKRLVAAAHRQVVNKETPGPTRLPVGLPVEAGDRDNIGAVLAADAGPYRAGSIITPQVQEALKDLGVKDLLIHSPMTELSEDGGISRWAAGRRDRHGLSRIGDNVGVAAAQVIGEKLSQNTLASKHSSLLGNSQRASRSGMQYLNRLLDGPENFPEAGPLAESAGVVGEVRKAPQGGHEVQVGEQTYYVGSGLGVQVKPGDHVEQGDDISDGVPHPRDLVRLRGLGQARKDYVRYLQEGLSDSGVQVGRRTVESAVAGLLNWARVTDPDGIDDAVVDDIVPANRLMARYRARPDSSLTSPGQSEGRYLEEPALHYTPGTYVTGRVAKDLAKWKVQAVQTHDQPPGFEPHMERSVMAVYHDPDWQTRLSGFYTSGSLLESLHRGRSSDTNSTSYVPALTQGTGFGSQLATTGSYGALDPTVPVVPASQSLRIPRLPGSSTHALDL